ncbi:MAG: translation initiation factor IF-2 [Patescibacteria group bacterium]
MNVSELARRLRSNPRELLEALPQFGFGIGARAVKVDNRVAQQIMNQWPSIQRELRRRAAVARDAQKEREVGARRESGAAIVIPAVLTVREFAERLGLPVTRVVAELMKSGVLASQNERIDRDTATIVAGDLGFQVQAEAAAAVGTDTASQSRLVEVLEGDGAAAGEPRAPVVVVMGHVDHGKTKLLDAVRRTHIMEGESGGITQHIGAYQTVWRSKDGSTRAITFIDTPGHEAFTVMRSRGAKVADIAILVVAADDGVQPQTLEALQIIQAAKLPFVVAINKIDKEDANPDKVKTELSQRGVQPEEWGGTVPMVPISAREKMNIDKLLDVLLLVADLNAETIRAPHNRPAIGTIIESHVDKGEGPVATVLVQAGTLHIGDPLVVEHEIYGKARAMKDYRGADVTEAAPSMPVKILGFKVAPDVGDILDVERAADATVIDIKQKRTAQRGAERASVTATMPETEGAEGKKHVALFVKADMLGSLEAILGELEKMQYAEIGVRVVGKGLGNITDDDVHRAKAAEAFLLGFKVNPTPIADELMREEKVVFNRYDVIYDLLKFVRAELEQTLGAEKVETAVARAVVLKIFRTEKKSQTLGIRVENGTIVSGLHARVMRKGEIVGEAKLASLQMGRSATKSVASGSECGVGIEGRAEAQEGDALEFYMVTEKKKVLV